MDPVTIASLFGVIATAYFASVGAIATGYLLGNCFVSLSHYAKFKELPKSRLEEELAILKEQNEELSKKNRELIQEQENLFREVLEKIKRTI